MYFMNKENIGHATSNFLCSHPSRRIPVARSVPVLAGRKNEPLGCNLAGYVSRTSRK